MKDEAQKQQAPEYVPTEEVRQQMVNNVYRAYEVGLIDAKERDEMLAHLEKIRTSNQTGV